MTARAARLLKPSEAPLTRTELARLLTAFASLVLRAEDLGDVPKAPRSRRRTKRGAPPDELAMQRATDALRRAGVLP